MLSKVIKLLIAIIYVCYISAKIRLVLSWKHPLPPLSSPSVLSFHLISGILIHEQQETHLKDFSVIENGDILMSAHHLSKCDPPR